MGAYVVLTVFLYQKAPRSKEPGTISGVDLITERDAATRSAMARPPRRFRSLALLTLVSITFLLLSSHRSCCTPSAAEEHNSERREHGTPGEMVSTLVYIATSRFWFESFRTGRAILLDGRDGRPDHLLRERGSPSRSGRQPLQRHRRQLK